MTQSSGDDIQVLVEDQQRINRFSKLNIRIKEIDAEIDMMKVCRHIVSSIHVSPDAATGLQ